MPDKFIEGRVCQSCKFSGIEPADMDLFCGHPLTHSVFGLYVHHAVKSFCGQELKYWEQHPRRINKKESA